ncbi:MAG: SanA/YdcF family protein [Prosthecobacter sp.]
MKTLPPSRPLIVLVRGAMLLALGCSCIAVLVCCKGVNRCCWLVREAMRRLTHFESVPEARIQGINQVALVPGTSIRGSLLRQRVEAAARLYHEGVVSHLILSGDGRSASYHEPHAMRQMLLELKVPGHVMIEDAAGLSTYESVQRAGRIAAGRRLIIVTQELYCPRALLLAWGMGVDARGCALPSFPNEASLAREEKACVRALLDLVGLRAWTQSVEDEGRIAMGPFTLKVS